jgi:hypothetical protein
MRVYDLLKCDTKRGRDGEHIAALVANIAYRIGALYIGALYEAESAA